MVIAAAETLQEIHKIGEYEAILSFILIASLIILTVLGIQKALKAFGLTTKNDLYKKEQEERINRLSDRVERIDKRTQNYEQRLDEYADNFYNKQKKYHGQTLEVREKLRNEQLSLKDDVHKLTELFEKYMEKDNERTVVTLRASLWRLHGEFVKQGFITPDSLKTFMEMGKFYEAAGGNDIFHEKLKPEVEALEIRYPDGSIYTKI